MDIVFIDRKTNEKKTEVVAGHKMIQWSYETRLGETLLETIIKKKWMSQLYGKLQSLPFSRGKIDNFTKDLSIDMSEAGEEKVKNYPHFQTMGTVLAVSSLPTKRTALCLHEKVECCVFFNINTTKSPAIKVLAEAKIIPELKTTSIPLKIANKEPTTKGDKVVP
ncbi:hypothetical protein CR194_04040 [Salipaludibacillus keqinensis]|uniref:Uncharacterized protein n=1 Tax=Salipaludibacillus keqinensis TaxID=2045207 RepID=A0A323TII2_9BACI|nr:hypothetical protein [Salipaludibacillus keqinensis]PYZ94711.1 hypothetical protein CR194_04040 [Salipaludibacillus keqinensis]